MTLENFVEDILRRGIPFSMAKNSLSQETAIWFHDRDDLEPTSLEEMLVSLDDLKAIISNRDYSMVSTTDTIHGVEHTVEVYTSTISAICRYYRNKTEDIERKKKNPYHLL